MSEKKLCRWCNSPRKDGWFINHCEKCIEFRHLEFNIPYSIRDTFFQIKNSFSRRVLSPSEIIKVRDKFLKDMKDPECSKLKYLSNYDKENRIKALNIIKGSK